MSISATVYNIFFKKSSSFVLTCCVGAFFFERFADGITQRVFDEINRGYQWKDIKHLYAKKAEEEEAEE
jgi:hypothetical protein